MRQAARLAENTNLSVKQIAYSVGYQDQYLFSKMFKKTYGLSPKLYRERV
jgi:AraC-like DNA-binding protein